MSSSSSHLADAGAQRGQKGEQQQGDGQQQEQPMEKEHDGYEHHHEAIPQEALRRADESREWPYAGGLSATGRATYRFLYAQARLGLPLFFSDIIVLGKSKIPQKAPVIFVANHNNDLIDGLLIATTAGRFMGFWAKAPLFKGLAGKMLTAVGGIPVFRSAEREAMRAAAMGEEIKDFPEGENSSVRTFDKSSVPKRQLSADEARKEMEVLTFEAFEKGRCMIVFPEGTSHSGPRLLQLKDGVAWNALKFADHCDNKCPLMIVPVGLMYMAKEKWRSEVVVKYGDAFQVTNEELEAFRREPKAAVKRFTRHMEHLLEDVTLNFESPEDLALAHAARRIFMDYADLTLSQSVEVARRFAYFYQQMKDDEEVTAIRHDVLEYEKRRNRLGLRDIDIKRGVHVSPATTLRTAFMRIFFLMTLTPLAFMGLVLNGPTIYLARRTQHTSKDRESTATGMLMVGIFMVPVVYIIVAGLLAFFLEDARFWKILAAELLFGFLHVRFVEEERNVLRSLKAAIRMFGLVLGNETREELDRLRDMRRSLQARMTSSLDRAIVDHPAMASFKTVDNIDKGEHVTLGPIDKLNRKLYGKDSKFRKDSSRFMVMDRELPSPEKDS